MLSGRRVRRLEAVAAQCRELSPHDGCQVAAVQTLDVTSIGCAEEVIRAAAGHFGNLQVVVLNAGVDLRGTVVETPPDVHRRILQVNLLGHISLAGPLLRHMQGESGQGGAVMVMSSVAGHLPVPAASSYAAAKAGLRAFFRAFAAEARGQTLRAGAPEVSVTVVCPGPVKSEGSAAALLPRGGTFADEGHAVDESDKMPTRRCVELACAATAAGLPESWISTHPVLAFLYMDWLCPALSGWLAGGVARVRMSHLADRHPRLNEGLASAVLSMLCQVSNASTVASAAGTACRHAACGSWSARQRPVPAQQRAQCGMAHALRRVAAVLCCALTPGRRQRAG